MFEKVNKYHPDKVADRIGGAIVDLAYSKCEKPIIAGEVSLGHGKCFIVIETNVKFKKTEIQKIVNRISQSHPKLYLTIVQQDQHLAKNQEQEVKCGDNGIFKGVPISQEEQKLPILADYLSNKYKSDGKYLIDKNKVVICQSNCPEIDYENIKDFVKTNLHITNCIINPLGYWTGGTNVDTGVSGRKLGSDLGSSITGGSIHFKDLSKADVSVNIYSFLKAQKLHKTITLSCAIGDTIVDNRPYREIVEIARDYINIIGGFEKLAEQGLIGQPSITENNCTELFKKI